MNTRARDRKTNHQTKAGRRLAPAFAAPVALLALACATPVVPEVDEAEQAVQAAKDDTTVAQYASVPFYEAQKTLAQARDARDEGRVEEAKHLAYLAQKRTEIAQVIARTSQARQQVDKLRGERDEVRLSLRTREAEEARERARLAERQAKDLVRELEARRTERGLVVTLDDVPFAFNKAELQPGARQDLDRLAEVLVKSDNRVRIEGHTDSVGSAAYNRELSQARAEAVRRYLVHRGVPAERIEAVGLGQDYPVASNDTDAGRQRNRRVEIIIQDASSAVGAGPP